MLFAVLLEDDPKNADQRPKNLPAHLAFLESHLGKTLRAGGPLTDPKTGAPAGGMWLVEAASAEEVRRMVEADPFYKAGLRKTVRINAWKQVFADGKRVA